MTAPLISVIIPNYNYARFLPEAIDSVLAQTYPNVEIIVVDDGSTDNSEEVLRGYGEKLRWFRQSNKGVSAARNYGIEQSRGELLAFMDADDMWHPEKLERQARLFENPAIGMVYCGLQYISAEGEPLGQNLSGLSGQVLKEIALLQPPGVPASGSAALISRACYEKVGPFDTRLSTSADWDMWRRIACHYELALVPEPLVLYRLHGSAMHRNVALFERDMLHAFSSMFEDPAAAPVHPLKRHCYGNLYLMFSGSYLYAGNWGKSVKYALRGIYTWPPRLVYLLSFPYRRMRRRGSLPAGDLHP
jgi:glycosyltransferase involved in cell wall biosynthesis